MSREESDREDLLREATALVERVELRLSGSSESIVAGFRRNGSLSLFFGVDPVYQFNTLGELRRAYRGGRLVKADDSRLFELRRQRYAEQVLLLRSEFDAAKTAAFLNEMSAHLRRLHAALLVGEFEIVGQVPAESDVVARLLPLLASIAANPIIARRPNAF